MKIAQVAPIIERIPPKKYGGTERVVYALVEELVKRGHDVTLFASGDSLTSAKLVSVYPKSLKESKFKDLYGANVYTLLNIGLSYHLEREFDIIHDHNGYFSLPTANVARTPVVMTYHGPITPDVRQIHEVLRRPYLVSISKSQAKAAPNLRWAGTVYNGLEMSHYPFSNHPGRYLLFVGRISEEKGVHHAITVAKLLNLPLIIAAKLETAASWDVDYFKKRIKPHLNRQIRWVGEVDEKKRNKLMAGALAFLHPVTWQEPFGLTLIESMACGTPVVAFDKGSIPEIVDDGKSGFVVRTIKQMVRAVKKTAKLNRQEIRRYALANFNAKKMTEGYLKIYEQILKAQTPPDLTFDNRLIYAH